MGQYISSRTEGSSMERSTSSKIPWNKFLLWVRMVTEIISSGIQPIQNLAVLQKLSSEQSERMAWSKHWITQGFEALEKVLSTTAGECCVGDTVTMADCCLVPQVYNANRFSVDMSQFPIISRLNQSLSQRP